MENSVGLNQLDYKLELIKNKGIHEQSAIASFEVKKRLQEFVLQKKKREAATATSSGSSTGSSTASSSQDYSNVPNINSIIGQELNPLRKTASEPNIKVRSALKAKVFERRASPLLKRKLTKRSRTGITLPVSGLVYASNPTLPISGPNPTSSGLHYGNQHPDIPPGHVQLGQHGPYSLHHQLLHQQHHQLVDLSPPSSPTSISMQMRLLEQQGNSSPTPPSHTVYNSYGHILTQPRPDVQRVHHPLLHLHQLQSSLPSSTEPYPSQDSSSLMMVTNQSENQEQRLQQSECISSHHCSHQQPPPPPSSTLSQPRCKPLVRTLSSPLPLGQAMAGPATGHVSSGYSSPSDGVVNLSINSNSNLASTSNPSQLNQRKFLLQHIRQTVLTRASSKQQLQRQSFEEETEAAVEQEMKDVDVSEINTPSTSSSLFTCSNHSTAHLTPKAKFKRQFQQDVVSTVPGHIPKQSSLDHERESEYRHLQAALWAHSHLGQLSKPISGLVYASNPSLPITGQPGHHGGHHSSYHPHQLHQHHHQMPEPSPPSSPTSVSMQMRLLEQGHSSPPSASLFQNQGGGHIHHPQPQRAHHPLLHFHQLQTSLPTYNYSDTQDSAMVTNQSEQQQQQDEKSSSSQIHDPSQPQSQFSSMMVHPRTIKPLIRTLSSPLPLGRGLSASTSNISSHGSSQQQQQQLYHPSINDTSMAFEGGVLNLSMNNNNNNSKNSVNESISSSFGNQQSDRKYLLQHIRQTVITRVSSREQQKHQATIDTLAATDTSNICTKEKEVEEDMDEEGKDSVTTTEGTTPPVDNVSNSSTPSTSSPLFSCSGNNPSSSNTPHLTPKAKFLRQFLQDNISSSTSSLPTENQHSYLPPSSTFVPTASDQQHLHQTGHRA